MKRLALIALVFGQPFGCSLQPLPQGQIVLYVDTDAPLPPGAGRPLGPDDPPPLFDRLQVDVLEPGATSPCAGCSRAFQVDADSVAAGRVSLGIPQRPGILGYRARLRLYAGRSTLTGQVPKATSDGHPPQSVIDVTVKLPAVAASGIIERSVLLETESVGLPIGTDEPTDTLPGRVSMKRATWEGARRVPCAGEEALGEGCIRGGAFWMGNPHSVSSGPGDHADRSRLVVLSPFHLDQTEVTVAKWRIFGDASVLQWSGSRSGVTPEDYCTYTPVVGPNEDKPLNCVAWAGARAYCRARGGDLPTEAQLEYASGALASRLFVWGEEPPTCEDAVFGRGGYGLFSGLVAPCMPAQADAPGGPLSVGFRAAPPRRDRLWTGTTTIYDLLGNVSEWALDEFHQQDASCWSSGGVFRDPLCQNGSKVHTARGGDWRTAGSLILAANRYGEDSGTRSIVVGFRCALPGL